MNEFVPVWEREGRSCSVRRLCVRACECVCVWSASVVRNRPLTSVVALRRNLQQCCVELSLVAKSPGLGELVLKKGKLFKDCICLMVWGCCEFKCHVEQNAFPIFAASGIQGQMLLSRNCSRDPRLPGGSCPPPPHGTGAWARIVPLQKKFDDLGPQDFERIRRK